MRIAIVGGGIFGCTAAIHAARAGHDVHLFEKRGDLLGAASGINQFRLHEGYHYPRSPETIAECQAGLASFRAEYGEAIVNSGRQFYAIAREDSKTSGVGFLAACARGGLHFEHGGGEFVARDAVALVVQVKEGRIDPARLRTIVRWRLDDAGVMIHGRAASGAELRSQFDRIVIAAYAATNDIVQDLGLPAEPYQYEVVEKPIVRLPEEFRDVGLVVMDGPMGCCLDPYGRTGLHVLGHVSHAIHATNVGLAPEVPNHLASYLNAGIVRNPSGGRFGEFITAGKSYIPGLDQASYIGSMFTIRAVLPDREATDERPTLVHRLDHQVVRIFSGKIGTAVVAAQAALGMIAERAREAA